VIYYCHKSKEDCVTKSAQPRLPQEKHLGQASDRDRRGGHLVEKAILCSFVSIKSAASRKLLGSLIRNIFDEMRDIPKKGKHNEKVSRFTHDIFVVRYNLISL
jgi:hypothetical protein